MGRELAPVAPNIYGGLKPTGSMNAEGFAEHDATKAWDDQGGAEAMVMSLAPEVRAYAAEQVKLALLDYLTNAFADLTVIDGHLVVLVDASNDQAPFGSFWRLADLFQRAIADAENASDESFLQAMGRFHTQLGHIFRPPVAAPAHQQQARPVRAGAAKPSGAVRPTAGRRVVTGVPGPAE